MFHCFPFGTTQKSFISSDTHRGILSVFIFWHPIWHSFWHFFWHSGPGVPHSIWSWRDGVRAQAWSTAWACRWGDEEKEEEEEWRLYKNLEILTWQVGQKKMWNHCKNEFSQWQPTESEAPHPSVEVPCGLLATNMPGPGSVLGAHEKTLWIHGIHGLHVFFLMKDVKMMWS